jgi:hypothetical protein
LSKTSSRSAVSVATTVGPSLLMIILHTFLKSVNYRFQEDSRILHKRKTDCHAVSPFIPYSTNRSRDPMYTFVFETWNILLLMLLIEEVRKNRMNHEYAVITIFMDPHFTFR